jgi:glycosyltransferase involved in cell wall biosynthesis
VLFDLGERTLYSALHEYAGRHAVGLCGLLPSPRVRACSIAVARAMIRLGVDVGGLGPTRSGVHRYLWSMLASMMAVAPEFEIILYSQRPVEIHLPEGNWQVRIDDRSARMPYPLWLQQRCPSLLAADRTDAFWGQNHMLPLELRHSCFRLLTVHDLTAVLFPHTMSKISRLTSRLYFREAVRAADWVLADSHATLRLTRVCLGADTGRTTVVYPGCSRDFAPVPKAQARALVSSKFGLPYSYLLTVGNIEPRKAHLSLLSALESVPNAPLLVIVGSLAWHSRSVMQAIKVHERAGRIRFLGRVDDSDLAALYSAAMLTVYPSYYEGFGLPILEAMSCGCPVLCRWSSSMPEVGGRAAAYFRGREPKILATAIQRLLSDDARLSAMSESGIARASRFSFGAAAEEVVRILCEGIGRI